MSSSDASRHELVFSPHESFPLPPSRPYAPPPNGHRPTPTRTAKRACLPATKTLNFQASTHAAQAEHWRSVPYGLPISNMHYYCLDRQLQPLPMGVSGELYIGGVGVARGYFGRPVLTAERFLPDPFAAEAGWPSLKMYWTGDWVRWVMVNGARQLEFLGREDLQVKIRGYRIELGEVETALRAMPGIGAAVAGIRKWGDSDDGAQLIVVLECEQGTAANLAAEELRGALATSLPPYMYRT